MRYGRRRWYDRLFLVLGVVFLCAIVLTIPTCYTYGTADTKVVRIENTEIKRSGKTHVYLIFTDQGVFKNTDSLLRLKFSSSDLHGKVLKLKGEQVRIHYYGWRVPFFSGYPNIYQVDAVEK